MASSLVTCIGGVCVQQSNEACVAVLGLAHYANLLPRDFMIMSEFVKRKTNCLQKRFIVALA